MGEGGASRGRCAAGGRWLFEGGKAVGLWLRLSSRGGWPHASPGPSITGGREPALGAHLAAGCPMLWPR